MDGTDRVRVVWVTSARDTYAVTLVDALAEARANIAATVLVSEGGAFTDEVAARAAHHGFPVARLDDAKGGGANTALAASLNELHPDMVFLVGYMRIVSTEITDRRVVLNLPPAPPWGPIGKWQEVIWSLIATEARTTGTMIHVATRQMDRGPVVAYCTTALDQEELQPLWLDMRRKVKARGLVAVSEAEKESEPLFRRIRALQFETEAPLIMLTLQAIGSGRIKVTETDKDVIVDGVVIKGGVCLTAEVQATLAVRKCA